MLVYGLFYTYQYVAYVSIKYPFYVFVCDNVSIVCGHGVGGRGANM